MWCEAITYTVDMSDVEQVSHIFCSILSFSKTLVCSRKWQLMPRQCRGAGWAHFSSIEMNWKSIENRTWVTINICHASMLSSFTVVFSRHWVNILTLTFTYHIIPNPQTAFWPVPWSDVQCCCLCTWGHAGRWGGSAWDSEPRRKAKEDTTGGAWSSSHQWLEILPAG